VTITEFLLARIAEDEAEARKAYEAIPPAFGAYGLLILAATDYLTVDPDRVLAECEAKRRIVERAADDGALYDHVFDEVKPLDAEDFTSGAVWALDFALRDLASVYADHPDYREEWRQ